MYTANSMNCLAEAIGMALPGNGTIPAPVSARIRLAKRAGMQVMELVRNGVRPRDIMTAAAFRNAETVDMALGCSTNTMLHLPAIAHGSRRDDRPGRRQRHLRAHAQPLPPRARGRHPSWRTSTAPAACWR